MQTASEIRLTIVSLRGSATHPLVVVRATLGSYRYQGTFTKEHGHLCFTRHFPRQREIPPDVYGKMLQKAESVMRGEEV